jgi:hypothetical protein
MVDRFLPCVGGDDLGVELRPGAAAVDHDPVDLALSAARRHLGADGAFRPVALGFHGLGQRAFMHLRQPLDALGFEAAPVDPRVDAGTGQVLVGHVLPQLAHPLGAALLRQPHHALARHRVFVPDDDVGVGVVGVGLFVVDARQPGCPALRGLLREVPHQLGPLLLVQLAGQGDHELVDHPTVLPLGGFLFGQPLPRLGPSDRHPLADHLAGRTVTGDIGDVRPRRSCGVGRTPDRAVVEGVDRHWFLVP